MITNAAAQAAGAQTRAYKIHDQGGMHLLVRPTGSKSWQQKYRWRGREKLLTFGQFPEVSVPRARILQAEAKDALDRGIDPASIRDQDDSRASFEAVAREWHNHNLARWSFAHAGDVMAGLQRDVFPAIGARDIGAIGAPDLLRIVRKVEARSCLETAGRLRQRLSAVFGFAIAEGKIETDPAAQLGRAMVGGKLSHPHPALTDIGDCRALLKACERAGGAPAALLANRFLALTAVRLEAVRGMRWDEVDDIESSAPVWRVPAARMKLSRAKKEEDRYDHIVPLGPAAVRILRDARDQFPDAGELVFRGRGKNRPIGAGALRDLTIRAGYAGRHVPHGWRSSFSTILNETLGEEWRSAIDLALAHSPKDKVEAAYNRAQLLGRRRDLMVKWGEMLTSAPEYA